MQTGVPCGVAVLTLDVYNYDVCVLLSMARAVACFHVMLTTNLGL